MKRCSCASAAPNGPPAPGCTRSDESNIGRCLIARTAGGRLSWEVFDPSPEYLCRYASDDFILESNDTRSRLWRRR